MASPARRPSVTPEARTSQEQLAIGATASAVRRAKRAHSSSESRLTSPPVRPVDFTFLNLSGWQRQAMLSLFRLGSGEVLLASLLAVVIRPTCTTGGGLHSMRVDHPPRG
eukprot:4544652-Pleurochrysis_carterae.AAC.1